MDPITILLVDDHRLIRESWSFLLGLDNRFKIIAEATNSDEAISMAQEKKPDVVLMDINIPPADGFVATTAIRDSSPDSRIIAVTMHALPAYAKKMFKAGAVGYVTKNSSADELVKAILEVHRGKKYICMEVQNIISQKSLEGTPARHDITDLTLREIEVAQLVKEGLSSKEMAERLRVSSKTIEVQRANLLKKLHLKNTAALVEFMHANGL
jgi:DNA-binding NarL/FixJ family response regulator